MADKKTIVVMGATGSQGGGLVRAILNDKNGPFAVRAVTRDVNSEKAKALAADGAEVVAGDLDNPASIDAAFAGAYGAYCVTFFWAHLSPEREMIEARTMADAARRAGLQHVVWSTLEDTRTFIPLSDNRMPTLLEKYKVPHFDAKGQSDAFFAGVPTTYQLASFYWENFIYFGLNPKRSADGGLELVLPIGDKKLAGIASEDIGKCALGIFKRGSELAGRRIGLAGDQLTGPQMAADMSKAIGQPVRFNSIEPDAFRSFGFPGAAEIGNMFQFYRDFAAELNQTRSVEMSRSLNPDLLSFEAWLAQNGKKMPVQ
ncbi:MAG TPA: NmrA/HSCARG family protein [Vicinamibacterales bacterium]|jgi:uncharacterized protein YbjT (DUF2867 family)|nr:NmrA/HSCARG family protein [Vicinamibacterales bacterium]